MLTKMDPIVSADLDQRELRVQHHSKEQISYGDLMYFAFRRAELNRRLSDIVCSLTPTVDKQKTRFNSIEKKIPKRVGAKKHPCFTSLLIVNNSETLPSY